MKKIIRLTESDLIRLVKKVIKEQSSSDLTDFANWVINSHKNLAKKLNLLIYNPGEATIKKAWDYKITNNDTELIKQWGSAVVGMTLGKFWSEMFNPSQDSGKEMYKV